MRFIPFTLKPLSMAFLLLMLLSCSNLWSEEPLKILFLYGKRSHAPGEHEFKAGAKLLAKCLNEQKAIKVKATTHFNWPKGKESLLDESDAIIFYNDATKIVREGWEKTDSLAKAGKGLMFMHYAVHPKPKEGEKYFKRWIGGYFKDEKSVNPHWKASIRPLKGHPTANGIEKITPTVDEFYHSLHFCTDCQVEKLGVAKFDKRNLVTIHNLWTLDGIRNDGKDVPLLWGIERKDGGRGAGYTGGHFHHNWAYDELRQLVLNTIVWLAGGTVPKDGVPVRPITAKELNANLDDYGNKNVRLDLPTKKNRPRFKKGKFFTLEEHANLKSNQEYKIIKRRKIKSYIPVVRDK